MTKHARIYSGRQKFIVSLRDMKNQERLGRYIEIQAKENVCLLPHTEREQRMDAREKTEMFTDSVM